MLLASRSFSFNLRISQLSNLQLQFLAVKIVAGVHSGYTIFATLQPVCDLLLIRKALPNSFLIKSSHAIKRLFVALPQYFVTDLN